MKPSSVRLKNLLKTDYLIIKYWTLLTTNQKVQLVLAMKKIQAILEMAKNS